MVSVLLPSRRVNRVAPLLSWRGYFVPIFAAVLLHSVLFVFVGSDWTFQSDRDRQIKPVKAVQASLVTLKPKPKPKRKLKPKPKPVAKRKPAIVKQEKPKPIKKSVPVEPSLDELLAEEDKALKVEDARFEQQRIKEQEQFEAAQRQATQDQIDVQRYQAMIKSRMSQTWKRPPGARRNMVTVLEIQMVPTGEVVSVKMKESSGSDAFDQSVLLAVEKGGPFNFFGPLSTRLFDAHFRSFEFRFSAEELRL